MHIQYKNEDDTYMNEDQIVEYIFNNFNGLDKLKNMKFDDIILTHHGFGMAIRNNFCLWDDRNPYVVLEDAQHDNFPDQMSHRIIERLWKKLNSK